MPIIQFPRFEYQIKQQQGKEYIFDVVRKKWVRLTPEEWVRQNMLQYLLQQQYPAALIAVEKEIQQGELRRRCDIVVYKNARPWMIIECKEMEVPLSEAVLRQILRYNISVGCTYLVITNGSYTWAWQVTNGQAAEIEDLPAWTAG